MASRAFSRAFMMFILPEILVKLAEFDNICKIAYYSANIYIERHIGELMKSLFNIITNPKTAITLLATTAISDVALHVLPSPFEATHSVAQSLAEPAFGHISGVEKPEALTEMFAAVLRTTPHSVGCHLTPSWNPVVCEYTGNAETTEKLQRILLELS